MKCLRTKNLSAVWEGIIAIILVRDMWHCSCSPARIISYFHDVALSSASRNPKNLLGICLKIFASKVLQKMLQLSHFQKMLKLSASDNFRKWWEFPLTKSSQLGCTKSCQSFAFSRKCSTLPTRTWKMEKCIWKWNCICILEKKLEMEFFVIEKLVAPRQFKNNIGIM